MILFHKASATKHSSFTKIYAPNARSPPIDAKTDCKLNATWLTSFLSHGESHLIASMVELVDALDSKSSTERCDSSSLSGGTIFISHGQFGALACRKRYPLMPPMGRATRRGGRSPLPHFVRDFRDTSFCRFAFA
ncbi:MAG: hypothetical protein FD163_794 [Hyphomonadaceae bacterium]|nr:MAG: hypothetical protein FD163_794 [Hyphomonadaceae bacterium]